MKHKLLISAVAMLTSAATLAAVGGFDAPCPDSHNNASPQVNTMSLDDIKKKSKIYYTMSQISGNAISEASEYMLTSVKSSRDFDPQKCYAKLNNSDILKHPEEFRALLDQVTEIVDKNWTNLTTYNETQAITGFGQDYIALIGIEAGSPDKYTGIDKWAEKDMLNADPFKEKHQHDYEMILRLANIAIDRGAGGTEYAHGLKLMALCGLGRWQEAAAFFPKAKKAVTADGIYMVPYEFGYMEKAIRNNGGKIGGATQKTSSKGSKAKSKKRR